MLSKRLLRAIAIFSLAAPGNAKKLLRHGFLVRFVAISGGSSVSSCIRALASVVLPVGFQSGFHAISLRRACR
jgi:hypothetical protein